MEKPIFQGGDSTEKAIQQINRFLGELESTVPLDTFSMGIWDIARLKIAFYLYEEAFPRKPKSKSKLRYIYLLAKSILELIFKAKKGEVLYVGHSSHRFQNRLHKFYWNQTQYFEFDLQNSVYEAPKNSICLNILWLFAKCNFAPKNQLEINDICHIINENIRDLDLQKTYQNFFKMAKVWQRFLKWKQPKEIHLIDYSSLECLSLLYAAKTLGIRTIEYQHGVVDQNSFAYSHSKHITLVADQFRAFQPNFPHRNAVNAPNPYHTWLERFVLKDTSKKKWVFVLLSDQWPGDFWKRPVFNGLSGYQIIVKNHPLYQHGFDTWPENFNWANESLSFEEYLQDAAFVVSYSATSSVDAAQLGLKSVWMRLDYIDELRSMIPEQLILENEFERHFTHLIGSLLPRIELMSKSTSPT